jgi:Zn-dependent protease
MRHVGIRFSGVEIIDLLKAWLATTLAFTVLFSGGLDAGAVGFAVLAIISALTAGVGFLLHELMHKFTANRFGVAAEFRSNDFMLVVMILIAFLGFIFAAPGAVQIYGNITRRENGLISLAGPATNIVLALIFLPFALLTGGILQAIGMYGLLINAILGAFNLIPFMGLDGQKVLAWHKGWYAGAVATAVILVAAAFTIMGA